MKYLPGIVILIVGCIAYAVTPHFLTAGVIVLGALCIIVEF